MLTTIAGCEFTVQLREQPAAGYEWRCEPLPAGVTLLGEDVRPNASMVGAPAEHAFRFRADMVGDMTLRFIYRRPWEKQPREVRSVDVKVEPK